MSPQGGTRTTALIRTIPDMQLMVTPRATMLEVTSARATVAVRVAVRVAARTPEAEVETVVVAMADAEAETVVVARTPDAEAETVVAARTPEAEAETVAVVVATDACPTEWAVDTRSVLPREAQATKSGGGRRWRLTTYRS